MTELNGALRGLGLPAIVRFLASLRRTGWLRVVRDDWHGELYLEGGRVMAASWGTCQGLPAIEAIVQALPEGQFTFTTSTAGPPADERTVELSPEDLQARLDDLATQAAPGAPRLPAPLAVPVLVPQEDGRDAQLQLDRGTLRTLLAVDGRRTVRDIVSARGACATLWQLAALAELGMIRVTGVDA